jgi:hypothetical protein
VSESASEPTVAMREGLRGALPVGSRLRGYEILAVLGHGGFGVTYRALDATLGRAVAIKEYLPTLIAVREDGTTVVPRSTNLAEEFQWGRDRFLEEARILARLDGAPAIVRVFDFLEANGTAYMVMALLDGEPLERRLKRGGPLSQPAIESILYPLLDGLAAVHATGFLHRDIKPDNVMLDARGTPTLIDFGASRAAMVGRTTAMTAIFTPGYAAAEQFTSAKQGPWTDIYGLCATLYHAIVGRPPPSAFDRMVNDTHEALAKLSPAGFSPRLLSSIDAGLAMAASDRPQSIADWRTMLDPASAPDMPVEAARAAPRRRLALPIGLAVAALLALAVGSYYFATAKLPAPAVAGAPAARPDQRQEQTELASLRADDAAREKLEHEAVLRRQVEEETRRKIEVEAAEKKRLEDARQEADAEAAAMRQPEEDERKAAEAAEATLQLGRVDRQHVQVALVALGFGISPLDGTLGPRSREMVAAWQKARNQPATGFLTQTQVQDLLQEAAPSVSKFDNEQQKIAEEKQKAAAATVPVNPDIVPLEDNKRIVLSVARGTACDATVAYIVRVFANRLDLQFRGGWQTFEANKAGDFARSFVSAAAGPTLSVKGNLKTRLISVENSRGCLWEGLF